MHSFDRIKYISYGEKESFDKFEENLFKMVITRTTYLSKNFEKLDHGYKHSKNN